MKILKHLPYFSEPTFIPVHGEAVRIKPYQIVFQVSLKVRTLSEWDARAPSFPAILDTGNNHYFSIRSDHLIRWAGLQPELLQRKGTIRENKQRVPLFTAGLWLHPNKVGEREPSGAPPHYLELWEGMAVFPDKTGPQLPVLGLRALTRNHLAFFLDGQRQRISLRTPDWRTKFFRWLF